MKDSRGVTNSSATESTLNHMFGVKQDTVPGGIDGHGHKPFQSFLHPSPYLINSELHQNSWIRMCEKFADGSLIFYLYYLLRH
jgi:hypothetical protein